MTGAVGSRSAVTSRGMRPLSTCEIAGRPDSLQIMIWRGHAFVTHPFSGGFSVVDVRDPRQPRPVAHVPPPPGTRTLHLQLSDGILLVTNEADDSASARYLDKAQYFGAQLGQLGQDAGDSGEFSAGVRVYDVSAPAQPVETGFLPVPGFGTHRLWWSGGDLATASAMLPGYGDFVLAVLDLSDPAAPRLRGHWAPQQMTEPGQGRIGLHHAILHGTLAFGAWRAGGLHITDVGGATPEPVGSLGPDAWDGGNTHTTLPLPGRELVVLADEAVQEHGADGARRIWLLDIADPRQPRMIAALPEPAEQDFRAMGGVFGPHNLHENRPGTWQSEDLIFATYQNAGVRVYDISDVTAITEVGFAVPPPPARNVDPRAGRALVPQSADLLVTAEGLVLVSDLNAGISIMQFEGG
jgi:hypothetical protein